eukprot:jgi/Phyca11/105212/e_gw1.10.593.1
MEAEQTNLKLNCLGLVNVFSTNDQISRLAETMGTPSSHIAKHISELGLSGSETSCTIDESNVRALLNMLKTNRKLTYLSIGISPELQISHHEAFQQYHGESLPVVKSKVSLTAKMAFLSAVRNEMCLNSAANALDDSVLSIILEFASTCATRAVTIHYDD